MKKKVLSLVIALALVVVTAFASLAATKSGVIELADLKRFQELVAKEKGWNCKIINYAKIAPNEWMVKLECKDAAGHAQQCCGDFRVQFSATAPKAGTNLGKCWYWFGLYDNTNNICGYGIATREYQGMAGQQYLGYAQPNSWTIPEFQ